MGVGNRLARGIYEQLPDRVRTELKNKRAEVRGLGQLKQNQALLALRLAAVESHLGLVEDEPDPVVDERFPAGVSSRLCTHAQYDEPWFGRWCEAIGVEPLLHRKIWEFAYIAHMLDSTGVLGPGSRGLGFGVGREPLVAAFAAAGAEVTATDLEPTSSEALGWVRSDQHASSVEGLQHPEVCDPDVFRSRVSWRAADMTDIPADLGGYDFCWSTCAFEHLGTLAAGLQFVEDSVATLRPGGIAVHTTEFNVLSDDDTIEAGPTVVYRERDLLAFRDRMESQGHHVAAFDFNRGHRLLDHYVDLPPYRDEPVLRFHFANYALTSVGIVIRAHGAR